LNIKENESSQSFSKHSSDISGTSDEIEPMGDIEFKKADFRMIEGF
jgi:hypothetical protein